MIRTTARHLDDTASTRRFQPSSERRLGGAADRHEALLVALTCQTQETIIEREVVKVERRDFRDSCPGSVQQLENGSIPEAERIVATDSVKEAEDLFFGQCLRDPRGHTYNRCAL
jgi:hypothetical protein